MKFKVFFVIVSTIFFVSSRCYSQSMQLPDIEQSHWKSYNSYFQKPDEILSILDNLLAKGYLLVYSIMDPQPSASGYAEFGLKNITNSQVHETITIYTADVTNGGKRKLTCGLVVDTDSFQQYLSWRESLKNNANYRLVKYDYEQRQYAYKINNDNISLGPVYILDTRLPSAKKKTKNSNLNMALKKIVKDPIIYRLEYRLEQ